VEAAPPSTGSPDHRPDRACQRLGRRRRSRVLAIIVGAQRIDRRIPGALLGLILSIVAVDALGLASHHGVAVLGTVHEGLPHFRLPSASWSQLRQLLPAAFTVAFVCIAQTAATVRASTARTSEPATSIETWSALAPGASPPG